MFGGAGAPPPHHLAAPRRAAKVRGKDGPPRRCLSTFPAWPSVRKGEALLGIRRWLWVAIPLSLPAPAPQHHPWGCRWGWMPPGRREGDASHGALLWAPRQGLGAADLPRCRVTPRETPAAKGAGTRMWLCPTGSHSQRWAAFTAGDVTLGGTGMVVEAVSLHSARASRASPCQAALLDPLHRVTSTWQLWLRPCRCLPMVRSDQMWRG